MARKFSLKDNPIFQRLEIPQPRSLDTSISVVSVGKEEEKILLPSSEDDLEERIDPQILTLKNRPSNLLSESLPSRDAKTEEEAETNINSSNENEEQFEKTENGEVDSLIVHEASPLGLREHIEKSLFFSFYNEINDSLLPTLETAEQVLYARLFRLSYGFNRNYCTVSQPLLQERTGLSRNTVRTSLRSLLKRELIAVIDSGKHISTTYRIFLPRERIVGSKSDPQNQRLKK